MPSKRDQLVETAMALFCRHGFHATGIDAILREAGVAKMTLYNHFRSKEELILAALRLRDERFRNWFMKRVESLAAGPRERILAMFDVLEEWFGQKDFTGCLFVNASAEYANSDNPIHAASGEHKRLFLKYVHESLELAGFADPGARDLAEHLCLLVDGAIVAAQVAGDRSAAQKAKIAAATLLDAAQSTCEAADPPRG